MLCIFSLIQLHSQPLLEMSCTKKREVMANISLTSSITVCAERGVSVEKRRLAHEGGAG
mgnify:CR=1 FL=1